MDTERLSANTTGFGLALAVTSVFSAIMVFIKESNEGVLNFLKSFGHHWVTHGVLNIVLFVVLGLVFARMNGGKGPDLTPAGLTKTVAYTVIVCALAIAGFYLIEG
jgi:putative flippase GtrA